MPAGKTKESASDRRDAVRPRGLETSQMMCGECVYGEC